VIDFMMGVMFMVGLLAAFSLWGCLGLLILYLLDADSKTYAETVLLSLTFPIGVLGLLMKEIDSKLVPREKGDAERL